LHDAFVSVHNANVSVRQRGFRFGDGVFETVRVHNGLPYQWDLHVKRLRTSLSAVKIAFDLSGLQDICRQLLLTNTVKQGFLRISISRGEGSRGYLPDIKNGPLLVIETVDATPDITEPVDLYLSSLRKIPNECIPSAAKTMQGLNSTLARMEAAENNCFEALLLSVNGKICEGSSSNIFWVKNKIVYTPDVKSGILCGTMRDAVIRLSPYKIVQDEFDLTDLQTADEVFITNSAWVIVPIKSLKPQGWNWKNFDIAAEIKQLIMEDMNRHAA
jgi:branched-chain amino acid aminotransferase